MSDETQLTAKKQLQFLKSTITGGVLFLLPVGLILFLLEHVFGIAKSALEPALRYVETETQMRETVLALLAVAALLLIALLAGLVERTRFGRRILHNLEESVLGNFPQYRVMKHMAHNAANIENADGLKAALLAIEGGWQLGYAMANLQDGWYTTFLPQAPTPLSGTILYLPEEKVRLLDIKLGDAMNIVRRLGANSKAALAGVDLTLPPED